MKGEGGGGRCRSARRSGRLASGRKKKSQRNDIKLVEIEVKSLHCPSPLLSLLSNLTSIQLLYIRFREKGGVWALRLKGDSRKKSKKNSRRSQKKVTGYEMELKRSQFLTRLQISQKFTSRHQRLSNALQHFIMCSSNRSI